jgi:serine protease
MFINIVIFSFVIASKFIVKLGPGVESQGSALDLEWVRSILAKHDTLGTADSQRRASSVTYQYNFNNFIGFAVETTLDAITEIETNPNVEYWAYDNPIVLHAPAPQEDKQVGSAKSWGIDRIDQRALPLDEKFKDLPNKGEGITVFVIDTGIDSRHPEFEGRAKVGPSFVNGVITNLTTDNSDTNGHGTHCAGTIASKSYGVAPKANIVSLKIFDNKGGGDAGVIAALQYAVQNAIPGKSVISMSIGTDLGNCVPDPRPNQEGCNNPAIKAAVRAAVLSNIPVAVSAGNDNTDACRVAPASEALAYTVASSTRSDSKSSFSNYGSCVDIVAPGSGIVSTYLNSRISTLSGTSMAAPHVAGVFAVLLSRNNYTSAQNVYDEVTSLATKDVVTGLPGNTFNRLLYVD